MTIHHLAQFLNQCTLSYMKITLLCACMYSLVCVNEVLFTVSVHY